MIGSELLLVLAVCFVGFLMYSKWILEDQNKLIQARNEALNSIPDFDPAVTFYGFPDSVGVALDPGRERIAFIRAGLRPKVLPFSEIVSVEVLKNGSSLQKTNRGSQAMGAAIGAALLGPVGLLVGGLSGSKRNVEKIERLSLKVFTADLVDPVHEVVFFAGGADPTSASFKALVDELDRWHGRFQAILTRPSTQRGTATRSIAPEKPTAGV